MKSISQTADSPRALHPENTVQSAVDYLDKQEAHRASSHSTLVSPYLGDRDVGLDIRQNTASVSDKPTLLSSDSTESQVSTESWISGGSSPSRKQSAGSSAFSALTSPTNSVISPTVGQPEVSDRSQDAHDTVVQTHLKRQEHVAAPGQLPDSPTAGTTQYGGRGLSTRGLISQARQSSGFPFPGRLSPLAEMPSAARQAQDHGNDTNTNNTAIVHEASIPASNLLTTSATSPKKRPGSLSDPWQHHDELLGPASNTGVTFTAAQNANRAHRGPATGAPLDTPKSMNLDRRISEPSAESGLAQVTTTEPHLVEPALPFGLAPPSRAQMASLAQANLSVQPQAPAVATLSHHVRTVSPVFHPHASTRSQSPRSSRAQSLTTMSTPSFSAISNAQHNALSRPLDNAYFGQLAPGFVLPVGLAGTPARMGADLSSAIQPTQHSEASADGSERSRPQAGLLGGRYDHLSPRHRAWTESRAPSLNSVDNVASAAELLPNRVFSPGTSQPPQAFQIRKSGGGIANIGEYADSELGYIAGQGESRLSLDGLQHPSGYSSAYTSGPPSISDTSTAGNEDITTIFVVGFPEDFQEREFINMFTFARGFEAATLKIPASTAATRERDAAAVAAVSAIAATLPHRSEHIKTPEGKPSSAQSAFIPNSVDIVRSQRTDDGYVNLRHDVPDHITYDGRSDRMPASQTGEKHRISAALASAAAHVTATAQAIGSHSNRKQIIGFAKFRTREDAVEARNTLSGRRIDSERGSVLKAEIAKKNLHTKKGIDSASSLSAVQANQSPFEYDQATHRLSSRSSRPTIGVLDDYLLERQSSRGRSLLMAHSSHPHGWAINREVPLGDLGLSLADTGPIQHQNPLGSNSHQRFVDSVDTHLAGPVLMARPLRETGLDLAESSTYYDATPILASASANTPNEGRPTVRALPEPATGFGASAYAGNDVTSRRHPPSALPTNQLYYAGFQEGGEGGRDTIRHGEPPIGLQGLTSSPSHMAHVASTVSTPTSTSYPGRYPNDPRVLSAADLAAIHSGDMRFARMQHKGDDNMPIATLYVGGLPAVLPHLTGPLSASHLEDTLRNIFSRCVGFRRLSFRHKSQGPMCFIEFEDVPSATKALQENYGHTLGGLVKGGIRLAYSKNPLGVRSSAMTSGPISPSALSPTYFASDAMYAAYSFDPKSTPTMARRSHEEGRDARHNASGAVLPYQAQLPYYVPRHPDTGNAADFNRMQGA